VALAAAGELVVEGIGHVGHHFLVDEFVGDVAQTLHDALILPRVNALAYAPHPLLRAELPFVGRELLHLIPFRVLVRGIERAAGRGARFGLIHHVHHPGADGLDQHLRAFALQELEHVEVAIGLR